MKQSNERRRRIILSLGIFMAITAFSIVYLDGAGDAAAQSSGQTITFSMPSGQENGFILETTDNVEVVSTSGNVGASSFGNKCLGHGSGGSVTLSYTGEIKSFNADDGVTIQVDGTEVSQSEFVSNYMTCSGESGTGSGDGDGLGSSMNRVSSKKIQDPSDYSFSLSYPSCENTATVSSSSELESAFNSANPCDIIVISSGATLDGNIDLSNSGDLNRPIIVRGESSNPDNYPVIDGNDDPGDTDECLTLSDSSHVVFQNIRFENCWSNPIVIDNTQYITIHGVDMRSGLRAISAEGDNTHHTLIQESHWKPNGRTFWEDVSWSEGKRGSWQDKRGETIYGVNSEGGSVIRGNEIEYVWNAYWDGFRGTTNMEIYGNNIHHVRDNSIEPESYVYNFHVYHNNMNQGHALISVDSDEGGLMYLYGNVGRYYPDNGGSDNIGNRIFKMPSGLDSNIPDNNYLDKPFYILHNSWYNYGVAWPTRYQKNIQHFNNAYNLRRGMGFGDWGEKGFLEGVGNNFDYDAAANGWDSELDSYGYEEHGLKNTDPQFRNPENGDYRLESDSPLIDAGTVVDGFTQSYEGSAPDIGAFEGEYRVIGPPFYIKEPRNGLPYEEHPRITRHYVSGSELTVYFSWPVQSGSIDAADTRLSADGGSVSISDVEVGSENRRVTFIASQNLEGKDLSLCFNQMPVGTNGQKATYWASTIGCM